MIEDTCLEATTPGVSNMATCASPSVNAPSAGVTVVLVLGLTAAICHAQQPHRHLQILIVAHRWSPSQM